MDLKEELVLWMQNNNLINYDEEKAKKEAEEKERKLAEQKDKK